MSIQFQYLWFQIRRAFRYFGRMLLAVVLLAAVCSVFLLLLTSLRTIPDRKRLPLLLRLPSRSLRTPV